MPPLVNTPCAAAIYARISSDVEGSGLGVRRQLEDCRKLAQTLGWTVAEEYRDDSQSAYSGKLRPGYQRMLADIRDRRRDGVLVYHLDRLTRRPIELEQFLATVDAAGVKHVRSVTADVDLGSGDGLLVARMLAAVGANESASKSRRIKRKLDQLAAEGKPHGGYLRPFGYEGDKTTIRPSEAAVIQQLVNRLIAGESLRSLCRWLEEQRVPTVAGKTWTTTTLRATLSSGRIAGLRRHRGQIYGPAMWDPIITPQQRDKILARFAERAVSHRRTPRRYLLSGLVRCGRCSGRLFSSRRETTRRYVCLSGPDHGGCGRLTVTAPPLEQFVCDAVLYRLDTPELADALAGRTAADEHAAAVAEGLAADRAQLEELTDLYATKQIGATEWLRARRAVEDRIHDSERQLSHATHTEAIVGLGHGIALRESWAALNFHQRLAVVAAVVDHIIIRPGTSGARGLDPDRVEVVWRL
jgi:site-specific DNA recombinase